MIDSLRKRSGEWSRTGLRSGTGTSRTPGRFIALVGPDGSGKTSLAEELAELFPGTTVYVHFRPPVRGRLVGRPSELADMPTPKSQNPGSRTAGWLRLARSLVIFWIGYLRYVRPVLRSGGLVLADRWGFGYAAQPAALRFAGPEWLGRAVVRLLPQPHVTVNLIAAPRVIRDRKRELSIAEIEAELERWAQLPVRGLLAVDATRSPSEIAMEVLRVMEPGSQRR